MNAPSRPAADVVLIGGPPGAGKTTLGRALAAELDLASVTGDDLVVAARAATDRATHPELHQMPDGHVAYFTETSAEQLIADAGAKEQAAWPVVERVVRSHLQTGDGIVLDWWLLRPSTVAALGEPRVASLWLDVEPALLWSRERATASFVEQFDDPEGMLERFVARSRWRNDLVRREAGELGLPVLHVVGQPVDELVDAALEALGRPRRALRSQ